MLHNYIVLLLVLGLSCNSVFVLSLGPDFTINSKTNRFLSKFIQLMTLHHLQKRPPRYSSLKLKLENFLLGHNLRAVWIFQLPIVNFMPHQFDYLYRPGGISLKYDCLLYAKDTNIQKSIQMCKYIGHKRILCCIRDLDKYLEVDHRI